jgi:hypothetical protein
VEPTTTLAVSVKPASSVIVSCTVYVLPEAGVITVGIDVLALAMPPVFVPLNVFHE